MQQTQTNEIRIVGAGIGGLTAAIALRRAGFAVSLYERTSGFAPVGAGILLAPNALRILTHLGVNVTSSGQPIHCVRIRDRRGRTLQVLDLTRLPRSVGPALAFHRAELHRSLAQLLPPDLVQFGTSYVPDSEVNEGILVGADGIYSAARSHALGPVSIRYSGYTCWRGICRNRGVTDVLEDWGGSTRVGIIPLTGDRLYVFLVKAAPRGIPRETAMGAIRPAFTGFSSPVPEVLDELEGVELLHHDIEELERPVWGSGRTILIGDAAHAMTPNQGQGASMAIEDAIVLPRIVNAGDPASALAALRNARVSRIQRSSRWVGELAHWDSPAAMWARDLLVRGVPQWFGERQYRQMIEGGPPLDQL